MSEVNAVLDVARQFLGGGIALAGLVFMIGGALGVLRFPDFYTRLHATTASDGVGAVIFLIGLAVLAPDWGMALRLLLLAGLAAALSPVLAHLSASAAHGGGLAPLSGRYTAPRPGPRSGGAP